MAIICNVPNREYISALRQCAKEHENENLFTGQIDTTALCNDTAKLLENDVIERSKIDKAIEELEKEIEENHLNEIDHAGGEFILKDFVYGAITRFKNNIGE